MGNIHTTPYFFRPKPLFGLDIGKGSLKAVQLSLDDSAVKPTLVGYGTAGFDPAAIQDGVVVKPELIAEAAQTLFGKGLVGSITSRRAALTIPSYRTFARSIQLPALKPHELADAVRLEAEQYIPLSLDDLYLDYTVLSQSKTGTEILAVAVPRTIVDSYVDLGAIMGIEVVLIESTMNAIGRLFSRDHQSDVASVIIDFGSLSADISIYDRGVVTTGTVDSGGQLFNEAIEKGLKVSSAEANIIKTKYGLGRSRRQAEIQAALDPILQKITKEIKRLVRYHDEHYGSERPIQQVVMLGGGANVPGLSDYFTSNLRLAVRSLDPWQSIELNGLQPPGLHDRPMFAGVIGLGLAPPTGVFK
ncbi:MAG: Pilus assembly protein PilM [Candidatus Saccharibacteria bacterium]|nr:Pilus assembly protein PilM [Candidatus Saccharibacteria bacterium]